MVYLSYAGNSMVRLRRENTQYKNSDTQATSRSYLSTGAIFGIALSAAFCVTILIAIVVACILVRRRERRRQRGQPLGSEPSRSRATTPSRMTQYSHSSSSINHTHATLPVQILHDPHIDRQQRSRGTEGASAVSLAVPQEAVLPRTGTASLSSRSEHTMMAAGWNSPLSMHSGSSGISLAAVEAALLESAPKAQLSRPAVEILIQNLRQTFQQFPEPEREPPERPDDVVSPLPKRGRRFADDRSQRPLQRWMSITATSTADSYETWEPGSVSL
ncbi:hypothetical protein AURDEDRAFT_186104 [Auricularia subglabra TFB-10046 SS5]|nr:hypothetical protein AURDEDRAFT_186104 [Auricularia subglabra TFB-10046 SS5]